MPTAKINSSYYFQFYNFSFQTTTKRIQFVNDVYLKLDYGSENKKRWAKAQRKRHKNQSILVFGHTQL